MDHISSRQNALVKRLRELARSRPDGEVLLDGLHLVDEALASKVDVELVAISTDVPTGIAEALARRAAAAGARIVTLAPAVAAAASPVQQPSGIVAIARMKQVTLHDALSGATPLVLLLDRIQDPGNVGAIVRAAEACGATGIVTGAGTADPFGWKALRGSMGSAFRLPVAAVTSLTDAVRSAQRAGIRVFGTVPRGGTRLTSAMLSGPAAVLLGGEGAGLDAALLDEADEHLTISMQPPVESLNVAIAAALVVYEASRQRNHVAVR